MTCRTPPSSLKSGEIEFLVPKDVQCSETYGKTIFLFKKKFVQQIFLLRFWDLKKKLTEDSEKMKKKLEFFF